MCGTGRTVWSLHGDPLGENWEFHVSDRELEILVCLLPPPPPPPSYFTDYLTNKEMIGQLLCIHLKWRVTSGHACMYMIHLRTSCESLILNVYILTYYYHPSVFALFRDNRYLDSTTCLRESSPYVRDYWLMQLRMPSFVFRCWKLFRLVMETAR